MQGVTADLVIEKFDGVAFIDVMYADSTTLRFGGEAPYDAQGYSMVWDPMFVFTKR